MSNEQNIDFVLRTVEERDIRFVRLWFTDVLGNLKSFSISPEDLAEAFEEGIGFDGGAVDGFAQPEETDMLAFPVAETFQILPWRPKEKGVARVFCEVCTPDFEPFDGDPRACLKRMFEKAEDRGFVFNVGPELEYFYFADSKTPQPVDDAGYFDLTPWDSARELRRDTTLMLEKMSIPVEYSYHSQAPSQNGIELRYAEALSCADNIMTARLIIKQVAYDNGLFASFMPKPFADTAGSAMFLYALVRARDLEIVSGPKYDVAIEKAYRGILQNCYEGLDGTIHVKDACRGLCVQGTYEDYVSYPRTVDAQEAVAAVLWALVAVEFGRC